MLRTADSPWLVSSWLMEWEGKLIWSQKKACCEEHKLHKKLQREGVYYLNVLNVFVGMCAHTREHANTGDVNCVCPLQQCMHAFASLVQIIHLSLFLSHTYTKTLQLATSVCLRAVSLWKAIGPCLSPNEPRDINTRREIYPRNKAPIRRQVKLCNASIYC